MARMTWKETYAIGVETVDQHHRRLFELVNALDAELQAGGARAAVGVALAALLDYTKYHFAAEEQLMAAAGYPELASHAEQHRALLDQTLAMVKTYDQGREEVSVELVDFLAEWLSQHTTTSDRKIGQFMRSKS